MRISDFDYELPDDLIARFPAGNRRGSRLLEVGDELRDREFAQLPELLREGDLLVFNDTRVIPARLAATKQTGGKAEILIRKQRNGPIGMVKLAFLGQYTRFENLAFDDYGGALE